MEVLIDNFVKLCLKYPDLSIESVFNRYMKIINQEQILELKPYFMLMIKSGEAARNADPIIQNLILKN